MDNSRRLFCAGPLIVVDCEVCILADHELFSNFCVEDLLCFVPHLMEEMKKLLVDSSL